MARCAKRIFAFLNVVEKRAGKRRGNIVEVFTRILLNAGRNIFCSTQCVFKKPQRHTHIVGTDVHRRMRVDESVQRQVFIQLIDIAAQFEVVLIPVKNHTADSRIVFDKFQQIGIIVRPDKLISAGLQCLFQLLDGLIFIKDAVRPHNCNDVHGLPP
ncbi:hypothetical protein D1872_281290 [compost metagenome]